MTVEVLGKDSFIKAWRKGYKNSEEGLWDTIKGITDANWQYVCHHPWKTATVVVVTLSVVALTAAYFMKPAFASYVNTTAESTYADLIVGSKRLYAFAVTNPVFAGLLAAAIVVTIGALIYMNCSKASQIGEIKEEILGGYGDNEGELEVVEERGNTQLEKVERVNPLRILYKIAEKTGLV